MLLRLFLAVPLCAVVAVADAPPADEPLPPGAVLRLGSARLRHAARVNAVAASPDGKLLASGSHDRTVRLWDAATGRLVRTFRGANNFVPAVAFSADGKRLAAEMGGPNVVVYDVATGRELLNDRGGFADHVLLSPDGATVYTIERNVGLRAIDVATGKERFRLDAGMNHAMAVSPDGKTLATGGPAKKVVLRDAATGKELRVMTGMHESAVVALAFAPDGETLASSGAVFDKGARLWDVATGKELRRFDECKLPVWSPDGKRLLLADGYASSSLWELDGKKPLLRFGDESRAYVSAAFLADGKTAATVDLNNEVRLWDLTTGKEKLANPTPRGGVAGVVWTPDGKALATVANDRTAVLWDAATGREKARHQLKDWPVALSLSPKGSVLVVAVRKGVEHWHLPDTPPEEGPFAAPDKATTAATPDGELAAKREAAVVHLRKKDTGNARIDLRAGPYGARGLAFSPDQRLLAAGVGDRPDVVRLWEMASCREIGSFAGHEGLIQGVAFSPDGRRLASAADDGTVLVWDVPALLADGKPAPPRPTAEEAERLADAFLADDPAAAYQALAILAAHPDVALPLLRARHGQAAALPERLRKYLADLDDDDFDTREAASEALRRLGRDAEPELRATLQRTRSAEVAARVRRLLEELGPKNAPAEPGKLPPEGLRAVRTVELLERIGSPEARAQLEALAKGKPDALETRHARAALARLGRAVAP